MVWFLAGLFGAAAVVAGLLILLEYVVLGKRFSLLSAIVMVAVGGTMVYASAKKVVSVDTKVMVIERAR